MAFFFGSSFIEDDSKGWLHDFKICIQFAYIFPNNQYRLFIADITNRPFLAIKVIFGQKGLGFIRY
jgi:hypothetical protein